MEIETPHAPETVPLKPEPESGEQPTSPYAPTVGNQSAGPAYSPAPGGGSYPPYGGYGAYVPAEPPRPRSSRPWYIVVAALAILAALVTVFAIGHATGSPSTSSPPSTGSRSTAATVAVPPAAQDLQQTVVNVIHTVQPAVVEVTSSGGQGEAIGSGVVYSSDGYIVTNDHVVTGFSTYSVTLSNGSHKSARLIGEDAQDDLAVLKVDGATLQPMSFANSGDVQVGEFSIAVGNPLGLQQSATFGIVSALNRTASEAPSGPAGTLTGLIQTSAPINHGNSGGALVDLQGRLIGIPTLGATDSNTGGAANGIGFAIASNRVKYVADQLIQNGHLTNSGQGFLGIRGADVTAQIAQANNLPVDHGVIISGFANDASGKSPAQAAGLKNGDIILAVNGANISDQNDLASALQSQAPGTRVTITIQRGSSQQTVTVTLGERPATLNG